MREVRVNRQQQLFSRAEIRMMLAVIDDWPATAPMLARGMLR
jgi:hypothetical protein